MSKKIANEKKTWKKTIEIKQARITTRTCRLGIRGGKSPPITHSERDSSMNGGLTEDVSEQDIKDNASTLTHDNVTEEVKLSVSDFITRLKEKEGVKGWSKNVRDTVASDDFAHRIARSMVNDLRGLQITRTFVVARRRRDVTRDLEITEDDALSRLDLEKKLNAVEQSLAEEKGKDEGSREPPRRIPWMFLNEADLRGRIESGEVDPEVLENLIEAA